MFRKVLSKLMLAGGIALCVSIPVNAMTYDVPSNSDFKSYMDFKTITCKSSKQYKLQQLAVTDENGLRTYDGRYCIALGNGFNVTVGDYVDVSLEDSVLECVVGDIKQDIHTGADNMQVVHNGNVVEFIVETSSMDKSVARSGNVSNISGFEGDVKTITVLSKDGKNYPEYTVTNKYTIEIAGVTNYIIEYKFGNTTRTAVVDFDTYSTHKPFESLYITK